MDKFFSKELPKARKKSHVIISKKNVTSNGFKGGKNRLNNFKDNKGKSQSYLDFGQKSFGKSVSCAKCHMLYMPGVEEDEKNHRKYCRNRQHLHIDSLSIQSLRHDWGGGCEESGGQRVPVLWEDVEKCVKVIKINMDSDVFRSSRPSSQRWRAVVSVVLDDMGATDCTLEEAGCDLFIYLDTVHGSVMGLIIAEQVHKKDLHLFCPKSMCPLDGDEEVKEKAVHASCNILGLLPKRDKHGSLTLFSDDFNLLSPSALLQPPYQALPRALAPLPGLFTVGVKQMWVCTHHRRRGIAHRLLESVRSSAATDPRCPLFISSGERHRVAFSQPTGDGLGCALSYIAPAKAVWLYSQSSVNITSTQQQRTGTHS